MADRPIIFCSDMVKAILDGRKAQTRRVVTERDCWGNGLSKKFSVVSLADAYPVTDGSYLRVPYRHKEDREIGWEDCGAWRVDPIWEVGDRLYVRETWGRNRKSNGIYYKASDPDGTHSGLVPKWRSPYHMPKSLARIWLEITNIRVERVQEISEEDVKAEGVIVRNISETYWRAFGSLWDSLNTKRGYPWEKNPWVWVIDFKRA